MIADDLARILSIARTTDPTTPVPSCPGWDLSDLAAHVGRACRYHALHVVRGVTTKPTLVPEPPVTGVLDWVEESASMFLEALATTPPDAPAYTWAVGVPEVAAFWTRRMTLETAIHRWDAEDAVGDVRAFDHSLAVDGVDEVLTVHRPVDLQREPWPVAGVVEVRLTDAPRSWRYAVDDSSWVTTQKTPDASVEGTASGVFLALWGREPLPSPVGDDALVAAVRTG